MTNRTKAQKNLLLARWRWPQYLWFSKSDGTAEAYTPDDDHEVAETFDISRSLDCDAIRIKLRRDHNITIKERTSDGKTVWVAISQDAPNMRGSHKNPDLGELLVQVVEGLKDG